MPERLNKNQATLSGMFRGEQVNLGEQSSDLEMGIGNTGNLEKEIANLPQEIVLYLNSMTHNFVESIEEVIFNLIESLKEKEAARRLWERFGLPRSVTAVPVFINLNNDLNQAQRMVENEAIVTSSFLTRLLDVIHSKIMLFYAEELARVEDDQVENEKAISQLEVMDTDGITVKERTAESVIIFSQDSRDLEQEKEQILSSRNMWQRSVEKIKTGLPTIRSLETPVDLGAPDPAMAL